MYPYKGYFLAREKNYLGKYEWNVYVQETNNGGRTFSLKRTACGYENKLSAKCAINSHFGRL